MANQELFPAIFQRLKEIFLPYLPRLRVQADGAEGISLDAYPSDMYPKGLFFGAVQIKRSYVSFHLMPVYVFPDLLDDLSAPLRKRMQGKSCFNFTTLDESLVSELVKLTAKGFARYERAGMLGPIPSAR